jgi:hypothetical protein
LLLGIRNCLPLLAGAAKERVVSGVWWGYTSPRTVDGKCQERVSRGRAETRGKSSKEAGILQQHPVTTGVSFGSMSIFPRELKK